MTPGTQPTIRPPAVEDATYGEYSTRSLDSNSRLGIRRALSPGMFRCARGVISFHHIVRLVRTHSRSGTLPQGLPHFNGGPRMDSCTDRCVCHLSVVSRCGPAGEN